MMMMNDLKMFRKFIETWHTFSAPEVIFLIFGVKRENFLMGLKINFKFDFFVKGFPRKKKIRANPFTFFSKKSKRICTYFFLRGNPFTFGVGGLG